MSIPLRGLPRCQRRPLRRYAHALDLDPVAAGFHIVVSGHSHKPLRTERGGVWYINPGSAGPRRFALPVTVARLDLNKKPWALEFVDLEDPSVNGWPAQ